MSETRSRCDDLFRELQLLSKCYSGFPKLWDTYRQTAATPLILLLDGTGSAAAPSPIFAGMEWLRVSDLEAPIALYVDDDGYVSSTKVLESLTIYLSGLKDYQHAELDAATSTIALTLKSGPVDPCHLGIAVPVQMKAGELSHYLRPNGSGNWQQVPVTELGTP